MTPAPPATSNISSSTGKHQQLPPVFPALHTLPPTYFALPDYTALFGGLPACLPTAILPVILLKQLLLLQCVSILA